MQYEIASSALRVALNDLGASVASVQAWGLDVALSPRHFDVGGPDCGCACRTIGPCCGRVRGGEIAIDGHAIQLVRNEGDNHLHGGPHGASTQVWRVEAHSPASISFTLDMPDGLDGYPGNRRLRAEYRVDGSELCARYSVSTDRPTWAGLTSHLYWDLTGRFDGSAMAQLLEIAAHRVVMNDAHHVPVSVVDAAGPFDFTRPAAPGEMLRDWPDERQFTIARGFNNAFILDEDRDFAARLTAAQSGLRMTLYTDQPAIVFYSGGFLSSDDLLQTGTACPGCALALEAQPVPDPFHLPGQSPQITRAGTPWRSTIRWRFERIIKTSVVGCNN